MRIVRYHPRALVGDGGMTTAIKKWSQAMVAAGASVAIAFDEGTAPQAGGSVEWLPVAHAGSRWARVPREFERTLEGADLLVLHSGWTRHNALAAAIARRLGVPYLLEPRGAYDPHILRRKRALKRLWWYAFEQRLVFGARSIHVFFEEERAHLQALGYKGPVIVVPNGVDLPVDLRWDGGSAGYLLWLGRFDPEHKGLDLLLRAVQLLPCSERPELRLHGPDWRASKATVQAMVAALRLEEHVKIGPAVYGPDKRRILNQAAGFVYPSRWDACPNSVLEAASTGVPTLVTPYPLGCYLGARRAAVLSECRPQAMAEGLRRLRAPDSAAMGVRAAEIARTELTWDQVARSWLDQTAAVL